MLGLHDGASLFILYFVAPIYTFVAVTYTFDASSTLLLQRSTLACPVTCELMRLPTDNAVAAGKDEECLQIWQHIIHSAAGNPLPQPPFSSPLTSDLQFK